MSKMARQRLGFPIALAFLALFATCISAQNQVVAGLQQLSRSPQYAPTIRLITANQPLYLSFINSPLMAAAFADPTGTQYVLAIFGSPIYRSVLGYPQTAQLLAASPSLTAIFKTSTAEAPAKLSQLFTTAQLPPTGNPLVDFQTLEAALATVAGVKLAPSPAPSPGRATLRNGGLPSAGK